MASSGKWQQQSGYVEGWEWGWSGRGPPCWSIPCPAESSGVCSLRLKQDSVTLGGHQLPGCSCILSSGILPAGGGARAQPHPRNTSPKRNGNTVQAALPVGLAHGGRAPGGAQCTCIICRTGDVLSPSQERSCSPGQPSKAQHSSDMGAARPRARSLVLVSRGAARLGGSQWLGCCRTSATSISLLRASSSTELFLGHGGYWEGITGL